MNVLSLFNGMGCLEIALIEEGIKYDTMYTSEVDKHALNQTRLNFPNNIELGDVRNIDVSKLKPIDFLAGGSPCQSFSFAGKRKGMSTKCEIDITTLNQYLQLKSEGFEFEGQSYLFWEYMRILTDIRKYNPGVKFLLENVEMGKKWERVLSEAIGVYGVHINSALVSAQNRKRIYWSNIRTRQHGLFGELHSDIPQPKDEGILLRDILESEVDEKYYIKNPKFGFDGLNLDGKGNTLRNGGSCSQSNKHNYDLVKIDVKGNPKPNQDKASCFTAGAHSGGNHSDMDLICVAMRGRNPDNPSDRTTGAPTEQRLEPNTTGKTNCLTSVQKDNLVMQINPSTESNGKQPYQQNRIYDSNGISPALCANKADLIIKNEYRIRRLTPTECARLQTVPEWYKWGCSDTQAYKMLGNGWTIKVIQHILSYL